MICWSTKYSCRRRATASRVELGRLGTGSSTLGALLDRLRQYALLIRLDRPIGTLLLLWPTLWALWIAGEGHPDPQVFAVFVAGVFLMRSAGCAINDFADRDIDGHVERTRDRPLAAGKIRPLEALALFVVFALVAFALVLTMNALTIRLAFAGVAIAFVYPFMKRFTSLPQYVLGAAFAWAVPMAFAAQSGALPVVGWVLFATVVLWTAAFDTIYAIVDREDDLRIGVRSTAILFADRARLVIAVMQLLALLGLVWVGLHLGFGRWYWAGVVAASLAVAYQQWLLVGLDGGRCFRAFLNNNTFGAFVFAGILLHYTFVG